MICRMQYRLSGDTMSESDMDHLIELVDSNHNRIIELGEFIEFVQRYAYARMQLSSLCHMGVSSSLATLCNACVMSNN
jgi:hypothetical protein